MNRSQGGERRPIAVDLFAGAGGMSLGFEQAGFDVMLALDHDPIHLAVHQFNFPLTEVLCSDIQDVGVEDIHGHLRKGWTNFGHEGEWDGEIDCVFGGPSCQGFSNIGTHSEADDRNLLINEFARLVRLLKPRSFVMENVPGLLAPRYDSELRSLLARFRLAGYSLLNRRPLLLDASNYGVPQIRKRVFIVGVRTGEQLPNLPITIPNGPSVADALDDLPNIDASAFQGSNFTFDRSSWNCSLSSYVETLQKPYGLEYRRKWNSSQVTGCEQALHSQDVVDRFSGLEPDEVDIVSRFKRLNAEGKSSTLRAGTGRDHGSFTAARPIHHRFPRGR